MAAAATPVTPDTNPTLDEPRPDAVVAGGRLFQRLAGAVNVLPRKLERDQGPVVAVHDLFHRGPAVGRIVVAVVDEVHDEVEAKQGRTLAAHGQLLLESPGAPCWRA